MKVFGVVGPGADRLVARLADRLGEDGSVAVVRRDPDASTDGGTVAGPELSGPTTYALSADGWTASGTDLPVADLVDRLAPDHEFAVLEEFPGAAPAVVLGEADHGGPTLLSAPEAAAVDPGTVRDALADVEPHETLESLVRRAKATPDERRAGAIATFTGRVRAVDGPDDDPTERLEFEKYEGVAERRMDELEAELEEREGVHEVLMHHRTGILEAGEDIVFVVVLAGHRGEAFRTVEDGIDRLKEDVPIFKKEVTADGEFWVHERDC